MDEAKAAAYYDELSRKGSGAARFKQGLGFSSSAAETPRSGEALPSSSSFYSSFVRASQNSSEPSEYERRDRIDAVKEKLRRKDRSPSPDRRKGRSCRERDRGGERESRRRSRSRSRERRRGRRSRSAERDSRDGGRRSRDRGRGEKGPQPPDYARLIDGYSQMSPAERVKAKMKLQLKETAEKDTAKGSNSKWERFDFDKYAPLDNEEIDVAEDDATLVKGIGQTFRFSALQAKHEDEIKTAHDLAMFGTPVDCQSLLDESADNDDKVKKNEELAPRTLISDNLVCALQQGSWRDRVRRSHEASKE